MKRLGLIYGIIGGFFSMSAFIILQNLLHATDVQGFILIGIIILSIIICCCTGVLVEAYESTRLKEKA
jgi:hypothetical protein